MVLNVHRNHSLSAILFPFVDDDVDDDDEESPDVIRLKDYEKACKTEHAIPQSAILRNLGNRDIDLRHRNVGTKNLKPFFAALKVRYKNVSLHKC